MWTTSTRLHSSEMTGCIFGRRDGYELESLPHYLGEAVHEDEPSLHCFGVGSAAQTSMPQRVAGAWFGRIGYSTPSAPDGAGGV